MDQNRETDFLFKLLAFGLIAFGVPTYLLFSLMFSARSTCAACGRPSLEFSFMIAGIVSTVAGCFVLAWWVLRRRKNRAVLKVESRVSKAAVIAIVGALCFLAGILNWYLIDETEYTTRITTMLACFVLGTFLLVGSLVIRIVSKSDQSAFDYTSYLHVKDLIRKEEAGYYDPMTSLLNKYRAMDAVVIDMRKISEQVQAPLDHMMREFYAAAGLGQVEGKFVKKYFFKFTSSLEETIAKLDGFFKNWNSTDKVVKI